MAYTAGDVMDGAASLMNDTAKTLYTYQVQIPYLKMAQQELEQQLNLNGMPLNLISEYIVTVLAGEIALTLPTSFFLPISLQERPTGSTKDSDFLLMKEVPNVYDLRLDPVSTLIYWDFRHNCINFVGSTVNRTVRLSYWRTLTEIVDEGSLELQAGANNYLKYKTAELLSKYSAANLDRAAALATDAAMALDLLLSVLVKNLQGNSVRRRRFRRAGTTSGYYRVN